MAKVIETEEDLKLFWDAFYNVYGEGIFIKSDKHPCGWDYVDLTGFADVYDMMEESLCVNDFCDGVYDHHYYEGWTPFQMLRDLGENWCFERNQIDWV